MRIMVYSLFRVMQVYITNRIIDYHARPVNSIQSSFGNLKP